MFDNLSERLEGVFKKLKGHGKLTEKNIEQGLKEVRMALLEADVHYRVVKRFIADIKERAMGQEVLESLTPAQQMIKVVNEELIRTLGDGAPWRDVSDDVGVIWDWLQDPERRHLFMTGDNLVSDLYRSGGGAQFAQEILGVDLVASDVRPLIDNQTGYHMQECSGDGVRDARREPAADAARYQQGEEDGGDAVDGGADEQRVPLNEHDLHRHERQVGP